MVSVIIPVFNGARFLDEAIVSVLAQEPRPDEVIVVDDASTDGSAEIARMHDGVQVIVLAENRGPAAARNAGAAVARGDVLAFHDADDRMAPGRLAGQLRHLSEHPEVDVVLGRQQIFSEPGLELPPWADARVPGDDPLGAPAGVATIRRDAFDQLTGYDESFRVAEDVDLLYRSRDVGRIVAVLDDVILERRVHRANATHAASESGEGRRAMARSIASIARARRAREAPVTAVLCVRDGARFVADAVKSVLAQTRVPRQILVIDDGSVDATPQVLAAFGTRITVQRIEPGGLAAGRNHALAQATEPYLAFCDADDLWLPEKTERQLAALEGGIDDADAYAGVFCAIDEFLDHVLLGDRLEEVRAPVSATPARMAQTVLLRRAAIDVAGPFDPEVRGGEFIEWLARAESRGLRFAALPDVLARRRIHGDNKTNDPDWTRKLAVTVKQVMAHHRAGAAAPDSATEYRPEP